MSPVQAKNNCSFMDEAGFHINLRNNWSRSAIGTPAKVNIYKNKALSDTIINGIHFSSVIPVTLKRPPPKKKQATRRSLTKGKNELQMSSL
jgi:hypothetical protein